MLERFRQQKEQVSETLRELGRVAGVLGMQSLHMDIEAVRLPKLAEERFNLVVLGEFNHGKTTFVNALLGQSILPAGITPTTATINHIIWGESPQARAILRDGGVLAIDPDQLTDYVTLDGAHWEETRYVELSYPAPLLRDKVTLVDTPGVNDINEARAEITYSYIPRADAVIFLLDSTQVLKRSERVFLQQRIFHRSRDKLIFALGKADLLTAEELHQAKDFATENLATLVEDPVVFAISPRLYLEGLKEQSGMQPLLDFLQQYLGEQRGRVLLDNALSDGLRTVSYLLSTLGIKQASLELSLEELAERVAAVRKQLEGTQQSINNNRERIRSSAEAIKATIRLDLRVFVDAFCAALPAQIDATDATEVKKYLQPFIQDTFKEWAEQQGDKAAELLEHLAEEIIQITNDNVHTVMDTLAASFGPAETRVELEVDTLRYDMSVFALGALGTTVFLFVNSFVGGLLTLAAPILAVVLKEKLGAKIKEQARQRAPEVIRRAGEAIQPRFEAIVDQFADRLIQFVQDAGETLHRGISELLDQALAERQSTQEDQSTSNAEIVALRGQIATIGTRLSSLRAELWHDAAADPGPQHEEEPGLEAE